MTAAGIAFWYGGVRREVAARSLRAVIAAPHATPVPGAPARVVGIMAWRGAVVTLMRPDDALAEVRCAVVVDADGVLVAIAAERVEGYVETINPSALLDGPKVLREVAAQCRRPSP